MTSSGRSTSSSRRSTRSSPSRSTHHPDYQQLEGSWRGLSYLVNNTETDETLKIRVMNISKKDLA
jgi:predicted component of type VI protein secretion system